MFLLMLKALWFFPLDGCSFVEPVTLHLKLQLYWIEHSLDWYFFIFISVFWYFISWTFKCHFTAILLLLLSKLHFKLVSVCWIYLFRFSYCFLLFFLTFILRIFLINLFSLIFLLLFLIFLLFLLPWLLFSTVFKLVSSSVQGFVHQAY